MLRLKLNSLTQIPLTTNTSETFPFLQSSAPTGTASFWHAWRWWLPPAVVALALVLYFVDPFIGDWDGMDYTVLSVAGYPSSMALGRNLFIFSNHYLYQVAHTLFNVQPDQAYLIFKYLVVAQAPLAVIACWVLARDISGSLYTATMAAILIVFSPVFVLYGGQVMTDVPSVLLLSVALIIHLRGIREKKFWMILLGAALLGFGVNLRETIAFYAPWLVIAPFVLGWKFQRREVLWVLASCVVFVVLGLGWFGYWFITDEHYRWIWYGWRESMRDESARHPVALRNIQPYVIFYFISAPLIFITIPFAPILEWRKHRLSPMLLLWLVASFAHVLLFFHYSTTGNWGYFLTGLPRTVPLGAYWLLRIAQRPLKTERRAFVVSASLIGALAITFAIIVHPVSYEFIQRRAMSKEYRHRREKEPLDGVMISAAQTTQ